MLDGYNRDCDDVAVLEEWISLWRVYHTAHNAARAYLDGLSNDERHSRELRDTVNVRERTAQMARTLLDG